MLQCFLSGTRKKSITHELPINNHCPLVCALTVLLPQARDKLLGRDDAHFLLLRGDGVEEVGQACEEVLLLLLLRFVGQHVLPERSTEVERLEHRVTVTRVSKLREEDDKMFQSFSSAETRTTMFSAALNCLGETWACYANATRRSGNICFPAHRLTNNTVTFDVGEDFVILTLTNPK